MPRQEPPKYKVLRWCSFAGIPHKEGAIVEHHTLWPKAFELAPHNESARRIAAYYAKHQMDRLLPARPYDDAASAFYLPAVIPDPSFTWSHPYIGPDAMPGAPQFVSDHPQAFAGGVVINAGRPFVWLLFRLDERWQAANDAGRRVLDFLDANGAGHLNLPISSFNLYDDSLWLPRLPARRPRVLPSMSDYDLAS
jgi:hypothetical protein